MQPTPLGLPILAAPAHADILPTAYVLHIHSQKCLGCGTLHEHPALYAKTHLRSRTGAGRYVINLRPLIRPEFNLPIQTLRAATTEIPFCQECVRDDMLTHLPIPAPVAPPQVPGHRPEEANAVGGAGTATPKTKPLSPAQILDLI